MKTPLCELLNFFVPYRNTCLFQYGTVWHIHKSLYHLLTVFIGFLLWHNSCIVTCREIDSFCIRGKESSNPVFKNILPCCKSAKENCIKNMSSCLILYLEERLCPNRYRIKIPNEKGYYTWNKLLNLIHECKNS